jgi:hypothetical protein
MMIYQEKIAPPLVPLTDDEQKLKLEWITSEDRWVRKFIAHLAGIDRGPALPHPA